MDGEENGSVNGSSRRIHPALELLQSWLEQEGKPEVSLPGLLGDLVKTFAALGGGIARLSDGQPIAIVQGERLNQKSRPASPPWESNPRLLARLRGEEALPLESSARDEPFLFIVFPSPGKPEWVLWLETTSRRTWSRPEAAALALVGQVLSSQLDLERPTPRWGRQLRRAQDQQRLEDAAKVSGRLAHDFGNLLTSIMGFSELGLEQTTQGTVLHDYMIEIFKGAQHAAAYTTRLRLFGRCSVQAVGEASLEAIVAEQRNRLRDLPPTISLEIDLPEGLPSIALAHEHIAEIVGCLLENAREAIGPAGQISLSARATVLDQADCLDLLGSPVPGNYVEMEIVDTGQGLSNSVRARLLREPFFTTKPKHRGFGLAIVFGILHANKGGFRLIPAAQGGTKAQVYLPVIQQATSQTVALLKDQGGQRMEESRPVPSSSIRRFPSAKRTPTTKENHL